MLPEEARWLGQALAAFHGSALSPMLNVGSNTLTFRTQHQPWIDREVFARARAKRCDVRHLDIQPDAGVDLVGDLNDPKFRDTLAGLRFRSVFCSNLLEHVTNREEIAATLVEIVPPGACLFVSCPFQFPYHPDPIDTLFRPNPEELAALFPGTRIVKKKIVNCGTMLTFLLRGISLRPGAFVAGVLRRLGRRSAEDHQVIARGARSLPWLFRRLQATCVVLQKQ
jgi:hypothetical protein